MHTASKQWHRAPIYCLKRRRFIASRYAAVQINNCLKITSAIKVATLKITDNFHYEWKPSCAYQKIDIFHGKQR